MKNRKLFRIVLLTLLLCLSFATAFISHQDAKARWGTGGHQVGLCWCVKWRIRRPGDDPTPEPQPEPGPGDEDDDEDEEEERDPSPPPPAPVVCTPTYAPPTITMQSQEPPYPVVIGQDPDDVGVDVTIAVVGGLKTNGCAEGPPRDTIAIIEVRRVDLHVDSINWITGELAASYPGAHVLDNYPLHPPSTHNGIGSTNASITFHLDPRDPGTYVAEIYAAGAYGEAAAQTFSTLVHLLDATITW